MSFIDWLHECGHAALELAALTSSGFLHAVLHGVIYGTPVILFISLIWIAFALRARVNARRALRGSLAEDLHRAHTVGLTDGIFKLILRRTRGRQAVLLVIAAAAMPTLYLTLEIPKHIVNHAIAPANKIIQIDDIAFRQIQFLVILCFLYLASLLVNGSIKYWLNVYQGQVGELLIRRLRLMVYRGWCRNGRPGGQAQLIPTRFDGTRRKSRRRRAMLLRATPHLQDIGQGAAPEARRSTSHRTAQCLRQILDAHPRARHFTVRRIIAALGDAPQGPALALFSAAGVLPVADASNLSGIVTCAIGAQLVLRRPEAELPRMILMRKISRNSLVSLIGAATHVLRKAEAVIETRWTWAFHRRTSVAVGILLVLLGVASLTPVLGLPMQHSASVFAMAVGLAERDGMAVTIGAVAGIVSLAIAVANATSGKRLWASTKRWLVGSCNGLRRRAAAWLLDHFDLGELLRIDRSRLVLLASDFAEPIDDKHTTPDAKHRRSLKARVRRIRLAESEKILRQTANGQGSKGAI